MVGVVLFSVPPCGFLDQVQNDDDDASFYRFPLPRGTTVGFRVLVVDSRFRGE